MKGAWVFATTFQNAGAEGLEGAPAICVLPVHTGAFLSAHRLERQGLRDVPESPAFRAHLHLWTGILLPASPQTAGLGVGASNRESVGQTPSCSRLCLTRAHCYQLDSDRKTRPRKRPRAHLIASTSLCTWRRRLWNRKTGKTLCPSLEKRKVRSQGVTSCDKGTLHILSRGVQQGS